LAGSANDTVTVDETVRVPQYFINGEEWIVINRTKTGNRSSIPILPKALEILKRYNYNLPLCSNQKFNSYLKEIATACGITKSITTHIGRHTFAITITLSHKVPNETVSMMLGHTDLKTTQIYAKVTDQKTASDMAFLM
jgi:integrase